MAEEKDAKEETDNELEDEDDVIVKIRNKKAVINDYSH